MTKVWLTVKAYDALTTLACTVLVAMVIGIVAAKQAWNRRALRRLNRRADKL